MATKPDNVPTPPAPPAPPAPAAAPTPPAPAAAEQDFGFEDITEKLAIPAKAAKKAFGPKGDSDTLKMFKAMPVGKTKLEVVEVPATLTGSARDDFFATEAKKLKNRLKGVVRRQAKKDVVDFANRNFTIDIVADETLGYGVRIWRTADTSAA